MSVFYTSKQAQTALGMNIHDLKDLVVNGQLKVFRDGDRVMYKVDEVNRVLDTKHDDNIQRWR